jgi:hypothetical protein
VATAICVSAVRALEHARSPNRAAVCSLYRHSSWYTHNVMMLNVFSAGRELVRWEVTAVSTDGPYRLGVYHAGGAIVEYFGSVSAALQRERELEQLFAGGRATYEPAATVAE